MLRDVFDILDFVIRSKLPAPRLNVSVEIDVIRQVDLYSVCGTAQGLNDLWDCFRFLVTFTDDLGGDI